MKLMSSSRSSTWRRGLTKIDTPGMPSATRIGLVARATAFRKRRLPSAGDHGLDTTTGKTRAMTGPGHDADRVAPQYLAATRTTAFGTDTVIPTDGALSSAGHKRRPSFRPVWPPVGDAIVISRSTAA
jgi:hypothetical protein